MITLNQDQLAAKNRLLDFIENETERFIILTGSAGCGKTVTISQVMTDVKALTKMDELVGDAKARKLDWYFTATTNKAKQAIQQNLPDQEVSTIHSLLYLRPYKGTIIKARGKGNKIGDKRAVLVIDECSYIDKKLLGFIDEISTDIKIIFIGDANQLTPVKSSTCPVFEQGYPEIKLTTLVRQTNAPEIAKICDEFKAFIESKGTIDFPKISLNSEIVYLDQQAFRDKIEEVFITNEELTLHNRVLAGTNALVNHYNTHLFELANGRTELVTGDTVVSNNFVKGIKTDEEVIIQDRSPYQSSIPDCNGTIFTIQSMSATVDVYVPDQRKRAVRIITDIVDGLLESIETREAHNLYDAMADLRPMYASTVHKSQGSTFETVYIDLSSMSYVRDRVALARLLYVALSRASKQVILTGDIC